MPRTASYDCYSDFVIRTPVFSLESIKEIPGHLNLISAFIIQQWENPVIKDAILLASPVLYRQIESEIVKGQISSRVSKAFVKYYLRMCYRSTPFGLFAAVGTGKIADTNRIELGGIRNYKVNYRLDMEYLGTKVYQLAGDQSIRLRLNYLANSSLYRFGDKWRYIEAYFNKDGSKKYRIVSVDNNELLSNIIELASSFRSWDYSLGLIVNVGYSQDESSDYLNDLINAQILVPEIMPSLSGQEFSAKLINRMKGLADIQDEVVHLIKLQESIAEIKEPGALHDKYDNILQMARRGGAGFKEAHLIQGDLSVSLNESSISKELSNKVLLGIRILKALSRPRPDTHLKVFKKQFLDRFGHREIPLPMALDTENGIGLGSTDGQQMNDPSPLLEGLDFPVESPVSQSNSPHPFLKSRIDIVSGQDSNYIELSKKDLKGLDLRYGDWPNQLFAFCYVVGNQDDVRVVIDLASSGNTAHINGRFGFINPDGRLNRHIKEMTSYDEERDTESLYAELVHLPEDRTGNILQRPSFYDWEIPYLVNPGGKAGVINPLEIVVSVENDRVILRRASDKKKIIPRMTTAHNYKGRQLPVYQFLAECAFKNSSGGFFPDWGYLNEDRTFLPGIRFGELVVSLPRWRLVVDEDLKKKDLKPQLLYTKIISWVETHKLPNRVVWIDKDREILIDWSNINIVLSVWDSVSGRGLVEFREDPFESGSPVSGPRGSYANQVLFSFYKSEE